VGGEEEKGAIDIWSVSKSAREEQWSLEHQAASEALSGLSRAVQECKTQLTAFPGEEPQDVIARHREWLSKQLATEEAQRCKAAAERRGQLARLAEDTRAAALAVEAGGCDVSKMAESFATRASCTTNESPLFAQNKSASYRPPCSASGASSRKGQVPQVVPTPRPSDWEPRLSREGLWSTVKSSVSQFSDCKDKVLLRPDWNQQIRAGCIGGHGTEGDQWWQPSLAKRDGDEVAKAASEREASWSGPRAYWKTGAGVAVQKKPSETSRFVLTRYGGFDLWSQPSKPSPGTAAPIPPEGVYRDAIQDRPYETPTGLWPTLGREAHDRFWCKT